MAIVIKRRTLKVLKQVFIVIVVIGVSVAVVRAWDAKQSEDAVRGGRDGCPSDMVFVSGADGGFCVDKYEASAGPDCPYGNPGSSRETRTNLDDAECKPVSEAGRKPWRFITREQAREACAKAGKRLPDSDEWYRASLGTPDLDGGWSGDDCQVASNWPDQPGLTGAGKNCRSGAGAYDMIGNVWEWVKGDVENGQVDGKSLPAPGFVQAVTGGGMPSQTDISAAHPDYDNDYFWLKISGQRGLARGGYWDNKTDAGKYAVYGVSPPAFSGPGIGFRCIK